MLSSGSRLMCSPPGHAAVLACDGTELALAAAEACLSLGSELGGLGAGGLTGTVPATEHPAFAAGGTAGMPSSHIRLRRSAYHHIPAGPAGAGTAPDSISAGPAAAE